MGSVETLESLNSGETDEEAGFLDVSEKGTVGLRVEFEFMKSNSTLFCEKDMLVDVRLKNRKRAAAGRNSTKRPLSIIKERKCPVYQNVDVIEGNVYVSATEALKRRKYSDKEVLIHLVGQVENYEDSLVQFFVKKTATVDYNLEVNQKIKKYNFRFTGLKLPYESFHGSKVKIRYSIQFEIKNCVKAFREIWIVHQVQKPPQTPRVEGYEAFINIQRQTRIRVNYSNKWVDLNHNNDPSSGFLDGSVTFVSICWPISSGYLSLVRREKFLSNTYDQEISRIILFDERNRTVVTKEFFSKNRVLQFRMPISRNPQVASKLIPTINNTIRRNYYVKFFAKVVFKDSGGKEYFKMNELFIHRDEYVGSPHPNISNIQIPRRGRRVEENNVSTHLPPDDGIVSPVNDRYRLKVSLKEESGVVLDVPGGDTSFEDLDNFARNFGDSNNNNIQKKKNNSNQDPSSSNPTYYI